jgi:predicted negative regulator of RcsB-dependent stress response
MSHYEDEAEVEQLRRWWRENWMALAGGLVLGLAGIFGWEAWQQSRTIKAEKASQVYEDLKKALPGNKERIDQLWAELGGELSGTPYASQAALLLASQAAASQDWADAQAKLEWVGKHSDDASLKKIARLRLARVYWQQQKTDEALKLLEIADDDPFAPLYQELRGDIQLAAGDRDAARGAWQKALELGPAAANREALQRKLGDLGAAPVKS